VSTAYDPPVTTDPFAILGLEPRWNLSDSAVEQAYLRRIASAHPDLVSDSGDANLASDINLAKLQLLDPLLRAEALLHRLGGSNHGSSKALPPGFLAEMMALREEVEGAIADDPDGAQRAAWRAHAERRRAAHLARLADLFQDASGQSRDAIRTELNAFRYTQRLIEQLDPADRNAATDLSRGAPR